MDKGTRSSLRALGQLLHLGFSVVITILIGVGLGYFLDEVFETNFIMVISIIVFSIIAIANFFITLMKVK